MAQVEPLSTCRGSPRRPRPLWCCSYWSPPAWTPLFIRFLQAFLKACTDFRAFDLAGYFAPIRDHPLCEKVLPRLAPRAAPCRRLSGASAVLVFLPWEFAIVDRAGLFVDAVLACEDFKYLGHVCLVSLLLKG